MNVIILQDYLRSGGTERQTVFLARWLKGSEHDVQLVTFRPGGALSANIGNIDHQVLQIFDTRLDWLGIGLSTAIQSTAPDCILCMGRVANAYAGLLQAKFPHISVVSTVRTGKELPFLYRWSLGRTRHIIANTRWWKDQLVSKGIDAARVSVVHNPLTIECVDINEESSRIKIRERFAVSSDTCVFVCVQEFRPGKHQMSLIRYFFDLGMGRNWQLWLVGEGRERKKCEYVVNQLGLSQRIQFIGFRDDPIPFYKGADIAVSVSEEDSLPNFLIEAQALGLPVLAVDYKGVREAFIPGRTGILLSSSQSKLFVEAANRLIKDDCLRQEMGKAARRFAQEEFSSARQAQHTAEILQTAVQKKIPIRPKKIVLSRPDRIGDVVITTSCFEAILASFPEAKLYLIVQDNIELLLSNHPQIEEVISLKDSQDSDEVVQDHLRRIRPCCLVHFHYSAVIHEAATRAGIPCQIGFEGAKFNNRFHFALPDEKKNDAKSTRRSIILIYLPF